MQISNYNISHLVTLYLEHSGIIYSSHSDIHFFVVYCFPYKSYMHLRDKLKKFAQLTLLLKLTIVDKFLEMECIGLKRLKPALSLYSLLKFPIICLSI